MSKRYGINMYILLKIMLLTFTISSTSASEGLENYTGTWKASMIDKKEGLRTGVVEINDQDGYMRMYSICVPAKCACRSLRAPIAVKVASSNELVFKVLKSRVLKGCSDHTAKLRRLNGNTLEGELGKGNKLVLKKR